MSQPMVHSFHVIFRTTKFHFKRDMDSALKFAVMKTELYAIILTIFIYITHVHLFCLFSNSVHSQEKGLPLNYTLQIKRTSTVPPRGYSVNTSWVPWYSKMCEKQITEKNKTMESKQANRTDPLEKMEAQLHPFKST